jgi:hypothetical protein
MQLLMLDFSVNVYSSGGKAINNRNSALCMSALICFNKHSVGEVFDVLRLYLQFRK